MKRIIEACQEQGVEEPTWRWDGAFVYVTFKRPNKISASTQEVNLWGNVAPSTQETTLSNGESIQELKTNREKVLYILSQKPDANLEEVANLIGLSRIGIQKIVGKLKSEGLLFREGRAMGGKRYSNKH